MSDVDLIFLILSGDRSHASLTPTRVTTDANGRAQTTLTFSADATGEYIIDVHRSDNPDVYTEFTVTVDPLLPKATRLEKFSGDNQTGLTGGVWAAPFVVEVRDQYDAPLAEATVTFTVLTGGGRLSAGDHDHRRQWLGSEYVTSRRSSWYKHGRSECRRYL